MKTNETNAANKIAQWIKSNINEMPSEILIPVIAFCHRVHKTTAKRALDMLVGEGVLENSGQIYRRS